MKNWWSNLTKSEKSAMTAFMVISASIAIFVIGIEIGQLLAMS